MPSKPIPAEIRFLGKISPCPVTGCWWWTAATHQYTGRPWFNYLGTGMAASRAIFHMTHGKFPDHQANHTCDQDMCVNPAHLYDGTQRDNVRDMHARGRARNQHTDKTHCAHGHPLSGANLYIHPKRGTRCCKQCNRDAQVRYNAKQIRSAS